MMKTTKRRFSIRFSRRVNGRRPALAPGNFPRPGTGQGSYVRDGRDASDPKVGPSADTLFAPRFTQITRTRAHVRVHGRLISFQHHVFGFVRIPMYGPDDDGDDHNDNDDDGCTRNPLTSLPEYRVVFLPTPSTTYNFQAYPTGHSSLRS